MAKSYLGLDIGTGMLKMALCTHGAVERLAAEPLPDHLVREGKIVSFEAMADFIREAARRNRVAGKRCAIVLPVGETFLRRVTMPAMPVEQLKYNLPYEFRDYVEQGKDRFFYDYALLEMRADEDGAPGEMDLLAAAVSKTLIAEYRAMCRRAGLRLQLAVPAECAYANLTAAQDAPQDTEYCIVDLGQAATRIYIYTAGRFETMRAIDLGGFDIDRAIAGAFSVDEHIARTYRESNYEGALTLDAVQEVYTAISVEVMKAVNFYGFNNRHSNLENAYFCGGGARIEPLVDAVVRSTGLQAHGISALLPPLDAVGAEHAPLCAAAIGVTQQ